MKNRKGFTIVELVIVIAVIGILAAVLIPTFTTVTKQARLSSATSVAKNASTNVNTSMNGTLTNGSLFVVSNDSDFDGEYWFAWSDSSLAQVDINDDAYPFGKGTKTEFTVYVTSDCFASDEVSPEDAAKNTLFCQNMLLNTVLGDDYNHDLAEASDATKWSAAADEAGSAKIVWSRTVGTGEDAKTYSFKVYDNEDLTTACVAFIKL